MKKSQKRNYAIIVLIVLLLAMAIGYAVFNTTLTITGTATGSTTWDVKFTNAVLLDSAGNADTDHGTVSHTDTVVTATGITLSYPGDAVNLRVTITNNGDIPAELIGYTINETNGTNGADITVTPAVAAGTTGEVIPAKGTCTQDFVVKWNANSTHDSAIKNFTVEFQYRQKTNEVNITPAHT